MATKKAPAKKTAKKTTKKAVKPEAKKTVIVDKTSSSKSSTKRSFAEIGRTEVSIFLAMAIEAMILFLAYLIIMSAL